MEGRAQDKLSVILSNITSRDLIELAVANQGKFPEHSLYERKRGFTADELQEIPSYISSQQLLDLAKARDLLLTADWKKTDGGGYMATIANKTVGVHNLAEEMVRESGAVFVSFTNSVTKYVISPEAKDKIDQLSLVHEVGAVVNR